MDPPLGRRGAHFTVSRAARYGANANYAAETRDALFLAAMIESRAGFAAIEAIAAVAGIDMLFLGPLDLTADFGAFGDLSSAALHETLNEAERRILASGKLLGGALLPGLDANDATRRGYHLVTGASDVSLLTAASSGWLRTKRVSRTSTRSARF
jgi:4-hydroxy-2-oxoheptanedioate aldolase